MPAVQKAEKRAAAQADKAHEAKHRRGHGKGPDGTGSRWAEPNGPGKMMGPSEAFSSTGVESRCRWS